MRAELSNLHTFLECRYIENPDLDNTETHGDLT